MVDPTECVRTISGRVFEDVDFAGTASAYDGGVTDLGLANVDVELYDASDDSYISSTTAAGDGTYSFVAVADGDYRVRVRSATIGDADTPPAGTLNATVPGTWPYPLPELTWANGAALYGGQSATADDADTGDDGGPGDTYVSVSVSGGDVTGVDFGFAYNLVVNTADDGLADNARSDQGSLRQFIKNANAIGTAGSTTANSSRFRIPNTDPGYNGTGNGEYTIQLADSLSRVVEPTDLDGTTQPDFAGTPIIEIQGGSIGYGATGLTLEGGSSTVRGFVINGFWLAGIEILSAGGNTIAGNYVGLGADGATAVANFQDALVVRTDGNTIGGTSAADRNVFSGNFAGGIALLGTASGNVVQGNYIGTDATGLLDRGNSGAGIDLSDSVTNNTIGGLSVAARNVITGNSNGIRLSGGSVSGNFIQGNFIGPDRTGLAGPGNGSHGIFLLSGADNNAIGGTAPGSRNVISGNGGNGVALDGPGTTANTIQGNYVGVDSTGTAALANAVGGVRIQGSASGNTIGGSASGARNVISGNTNDGIYVTDSGTSGNVIQGNYLGTNSTGTAPVPNGDRGVQIESGATNTAVGGSGANEGNLISGNLGDGVIIADFSSSGTTGNVVEGNWIGVASDGTSALGNQKHGVHIDNVSGNRVGGADADAGNLIAHSNWNGVQVSPTAGTDNAILGNDIYSNGGLGIDLEGDGITGNDGNDDDGGPNDLRNFPVITSATESGGTISIDFDLDLGATLAGDYRIEFFKNPNGVDATNGEGEEFASAVTISHGGTGVESFSHSFAGAATDTLTATTTDSLLAGGYGSTSEFSTWYAVTALPTYSVSGSVFEDVDFGGTAAAYDGGVTDALVDSVDVELYDADAADAFVASTTTGRTATGVFTFDGVPDGNFKVRVRSATLGDTDSPPAGGLNATVPGTWPYPLPELTWANGAALYGGQSATDRRR